MENNNITNNSVSAHLYQIRLNEHTKGRGTALLCPYKYHVQSTGFDITALLDAIPPLDCTRAIALASIQRFLGRL